MAEIRPQVADGTLLSCGEVRGGHQQWVIASSSGTGRATLPTPLIAILLLFDGTQTFAEITRQASQWGMDLPRHDFVDMLAHRLAEAGLVVLKGRRLDVQEGVRFECLGCGLSCCGPEVGPLPPHEAETVTSCWDDYVARGLLSDTRKPLRYDSSGNAFLTRHERGRCTFLTDEDRCLIHAQDGASAKPLACRLFPIMLVEVDGVSRLGISGACSRSHLTFEEGPIFDLRAQYANLQHPLVPQRRQFHGLDDAQAEQVGAREAQLMEWLSDSAPDLNQLAARVVGISPGLSLQRTELDVVSACEPILKRWSRSVLRDVDHGHWPAMHLTPGSDRSRLLIAMANRIAETEPPDGLQGLPAKWRRYTASRLHNEIWLRAGYRHGSLDQSLLIALLGIVASAWFALSLGTANDDASYDRFGSSLVAWHLAHAGRDNAERLIGRTERRKLLETLSGQPGR